MKQCTKCGETKDETEFYFIKSKNRYESRCRACTKLEKAAWKEANKEKVKKDNRKWQLANPDRTKAAQERWKTRNPGIANERSKEWYQKHKEHARAQDRARAKAIKDEAYNAYGGYKCSCCGESNPLFLSIDHINEDGAEHRRKHSVEGKKLYYWLKRNGYPSGFQILCMNCNWGKARNNGICPHKTSEGSTTIESTSKDGSK